VGRRSPISRTRRQEIAQGARRIYSVAHAVGRTVDEIQGELLHAFPGELAAGEARMYAHGWTVRTVREGLQALAAERGLDCGDLQDADVWRWLRGEVYPRESLERLCRLFRCHQAQLGWPARGNEEAVSFKASDSVEPATAMRALVSPVWLDDEPSASAPDWTAWFGVKLAHLLTLVDQWHGPASCEPLQLLVHQEVLMFDAAGPASARSRDYDPSRRQLLVTLLALPVALNPTALLGDPSSAVVDRLLAQCAASITAAWHLLKQSDLTLVERHVSGYLLALTALARRPSPHQKEAARLASQAYRALGIVVLHRRQTRLTEYYSEQSSLYAEIAGDHHLRWAALSSLSAIALLYRNDPAGAADANRRLAIALHDRQLAPLMRSRLHALVALELAMTGDEQEALRSAHLAQEEYPASAGQDPVGLTAEFTPGNLVLYRGLAHLALSRWVPERRHQAIAWETFEGAARLAVGDSLTERVRVEIVNHQAASAVEMRDLERFTISLQAGVEGALRLQSVQRMHEARTAWERARQVWPAERSVAALGELFADAPRQLGGGRG